MSPHDDTPHRQATNIRYDTTPRKQRIRLNTSVSSTDLSAKSTFDTKAPAATFRSIAVIVNLRSEQRFFDSFSAESLIFNLIC